MAPYSLACDMFSLFAYLYFCNIICVFVFIICIFALSFLYLYLCIIICLFVFVYLQKSKKKEHSRPVSRQEVDILARQQKDEKCVLFEWPRFKNISFLTQFEVNHLNYIELIQVVDIFRTLFNVKTVFPRKTILHFLL